MSIFLRNSLFLPFLLMLSLSVAAEEDGFRCNPNGTQAELNVCALDDYKRADDLLNARYRDVRDQMNPQGRERLKEVELTWIQYRDAQCNKNADEYQGGSIQPLILYQCLARLTRERIKILEEERAEQQR